MAFRRGSGHSASWQRASRSGRATSSPAEQAGAGRRLGDRAELPDLTAQVEVPGACTPATTCCWVTVWPRKQCAPRLRASLDRRRHRPELVPARDRPSRGRSRRGARQRSHQPLVDSTPSTAAAARPTCRRSTGWTCRTKAGGLRGIAAPDDCAGYFAWFPLDGLEWAYGYAPRSGWRGRPPPAAQPGDERLRLQRPARPAHRARSLGLSVRV